MPNIHKRKDGYYYVRLPLGKDDNGKHQYDVIYDKKKSDLEEKMKDYEKNKGINGRALEKAPLTLTQWTYRHLFTTVLGSVAPSTFHGYVGLYESHIKTSKLGDRDIKDIKPIDLQEFFNNGVVSHGKYSTNNPLAYSSLKKLRFLVNSVFKSAMINNIISFNPMQHVEISKNKQDGIERPALTIAEQKAYIKALDGEVYGFLYIVALFTGMRLGELIGLKWDYVDLKRNRIAVVETIKRSRVYKADGNYKKESVTKSPKSAKSKREIPINKSLVPTFEDHKAKSTSNYVFSTSNNTPLSAENVAKYHKRICVKAQINPVPFHSLRHTYATRLVEVGENFKTLQELLGHSDISTTMNIYAHVLEESKNSAADKLESIFKSTSQNNKTY